MSNTVGKTRKMADYQGTLFFNRDYTTLNSIHLKSEKNKNKNNDLKGQVQIKFSRNN